MEFVGYLLTLLPKLNGECDIMELKCRFCDTVFEPECPNCSLSVRFSINKDAKELNELFNEVIEYPRNFGETGVIKNIHYCYIPVYYLNAFINETKPIFACMIKTDTKWNDDGYLYIDESLYGLSSIENYIKKMPLNEVKNIKVKENMMTKLRLYPDNVIVISESRNDRWYFYFDHDPKCCDIFRISKKDMSSEKLIDLLKATYKNEYIELPTPSGWTEW